MAKKTRTLIISQGDQIPQNAIDVKPFDPQAGRVGAYAPKPKLIVTIFEDELEPPPKKLPPPPPPPKSQMQPPMPHPRLRPQQRRDAYQMLRQENNMPMPRRTSRPNHNQLRLDVRMQSQLAPAPQARCMAQALSALKLVQDVASSARPAGVSRGRGGASPGAALSLASGPR